MTMPASRPASKITKIDGVPIDRWKADHARFKLATKRATIRTCKRTAMGSMLMFGAAMLMLILMADRLWDMRGITWSMNQPMDLMIVACTLMVPVTFMALAMLLNMEACERLATLIENP